MTGSGGQFFNLMDKQSKSTLGQFSNLQDSVYQMKVALGEALLPAVTQLIQTLTPLIQQFAAWEKEHPKIVEGMILAGLAIGALGAVIVTLIPLIVGLGAAISALGTIFTFVGAVVGGIVAIVGGPLILIILAVVAVIGLLYLAWT